MTIKLGCNKNRNRIEGRQTKATITERRQAFYVYALANRYNELPRIYFLKYLYN